MQINGVRDRGLSWLKRILRIYKGLHGWVKVTVGSRKIYKQIAREMTQVNTNTTERWKNLSK